MPFKRLVLKPKGEKGSRGTEAAKEMLELMTENWDQLQDKFNSQNESEKSEMLEHFNQTIECLGDTLFGDDCNIEDFTAFVDGLEDEEEKKFMDAVNEALLIDDP